jgi:hypothetical protein
VTVRLDAGRYPTGPGEVAVTSDVATEFGLRVGSRWNEDGQALRVVGLVENPLDLLDQFALVAFGQLDRPNDVTILLDAGPQAIQSFRLPSGTGLTIAGRATRCHTKRDLRGDRVWHGGGRLVGDAAAVGGAGADGRRNGVRGSRREG